MRSPTQLHPDWLIPDWPAPDRVRALCSTRAGGRSRPPYDSLNLGAHVGDDPQAVQANRQLLQGAMTARPVFLHQVHGSAVLTLAQAMPDGRSADAGVSAEPGLACAVLVADCLPLLLCSSSGAVVGAAHAGWRGLAGDGAAGVIEATLERLVGDGHACRAWSGAQPVAERLAAWLAAFDRQRFASASLINNAALLTEPGPLVDVDLATLSKATRVGLEAPLLLTAAFLRATRGWAGQRRVMHISSGLGRRGMASAGPYCAVKAGLDNLARAQALEEARQPHGARVCSLAPGIIDTDMQVQLRGADPAVFPDSEAFVEMKTGGRLDSPAAAAAKVIAYLNRADFGSNPVGDVRDA